MKQLIKLAAQKGQYYLATYSAHASIIEQLIGNNALPPQIWVDGGGLVAGSGTYERKDLFANYTPVNKKTLHAKVLFHEKSGILWLSTGNLRKTARMKELNIQLFEKVPVNLHTDLKKWFNTGIKNGQNLILDFKNKKLTSISSSDMILWNNLKQRMKTVKEDNLTVYLFSPWGSGKLIKELKSVLDSQIASLNIYTRPVSEEENYIWADTGIKEFPEKTKVWCGKKNKPFPHLKGIFITCKNKSGKESVLFSYIGSANLTENAIFKNTNIEHACFFKKDNSSLNHLLKQLKNRTFWRERVLSKTTQIPPISDENETEFYNYDTFQQRNLKKKLLMRFQQKNEQLKLSKSYSQNKTTINKNPICTIKVKNITQEFYNLEIDLGNEAGYLFLDVPRIDKSKMIVNDKSLDTIMTQFFDMENNVSKEKKIKSQNTISIPEKRASGYKDRNIRFPIEKIIAKPEIIKIKKASLNKINGIEENEHKKKLEADKAFLIWKTLINNL